MQRIILDTDFLLQCVRWKVDLFGELERLFPASKIQICVFDRTLQELEGKKDSKLATAFTKRMTILESKSELPVDDLLLEHGQQEKTAIATQDKALKEKLKKVVIPIITIRKQRYLVIDNHVL